MLSPILASRAFEILVCPLCIFRILSSKTTFLHEQANFHQVQSSLIQFTYSRHMIYTVEKKNKQKKQQLSNKINGKGRTKMSKYINQKQRIYFSTSYILVSS